MAGVVLALAMLVSPAWGASRIGTAGGAGTKLADGFSVPRGARLVGGVVPDMVFPQASSSVSKPGWSATLWLDTDAVSAYNSMAAQAAALDMAVTGPSASQGGPGCAEAPAPSELVDGTAQVSLVQCEGFFEGGGLNLIVRVMVCQRCVHPVASMTLAVRETGASRPDGAPSPIPLPASTPTAKLSTAQQRAAVRAIPAKGDSFTDKVPVADFPTVVRGSIALSPALSPGCGTGNLFAVLALVGDGRAATRALLREGDPGGDGPRHTGSVTFQGLTTDVYRYGYYTTMLVVRGGKQGTFATVDWCGD